MGTTNTQPLTTADLAALHETEHRHLVLRALYGVTAQARSGAVRQLKRLAREGA